MEIVYFIFRELIFSFVYVFGGLLGFILPLDGVNKKPTRKYPIVFVHGWLVRNTPYIFVKNFLEKAGFAVYMSDLDLELGSIEDSAIKLSRFVEQKKLSKFYLIGDSCGALISLYYLQRLNGWRRVLKFVSVGGPFNGSPLALLAIWFSKAARQMLPNSEFLKELKDVSIKDEDKIICVSAEYDDIVPRWSSQVRGAQKIIVPT